MAEEMEYTEEKIQEPEVQPAQEPVPEGQPEEVKEEQPKSEEKTEPVKEADQPKASQEPAGENRRTFQGRRLHFGDEEDNFYRDEEIISKLEGEDLLKYLAMEQEKEEHRREAKEVRERQDLLRLPAYHIAGSHRGSGRFPEGQPHRTGKYPLYRGHPDRSLDPETAQRPISGESSPGRQKKKAAPDGFPAGFCLFFSLIFQIAPEA